MGDVKYAGFWRRLGAFLLDVLILCVLVFLLLPVAMLLFSLDKSHTIAMIVLTPCFLLIVFGYNPYFLVTRGATPGKMIFGLIVIDENNRYPISLGKALIREILGKHIIDRLTLNLGNLLIVFDTKKQSLHDKISGTYVVHKDSLMPGIIDQKGEN